MNVYHAISDTLNQQTNMTYLVIGRKPYLHLYKPLYTIFSACIELCNLIAYTVFTNILIRII